MSRTLLLSLAAITAAGKAGPMALREAVQKALGVAMAFEGRSLTIATPPVSASTAATRPTPELPAPESFTAKRLTAEVMLSLEGPLWQLTRYVADSGAKIDAQPYRTERPTLQFKDGRMGGNATCNRFFGSYEIAGNALTIRPGGSTLMACPPEYMAQEQSFLTALGQVAHYEIVDSTLLLKNTAGETLLTLSELISPDLTSTLWELVGYNNGRGGVVSSIAGTHITATFDAGGRLVGSAGCNNYTASYSQIDGVLSIGPAASTRKFCAQPDGIMAQESAYLQALERVTSYALDGNSLTLRGAAGETIAQFRTLEAAEAP